jgi:hypothetical protein
MGAGGRLWGRAGWLSYLESTQARGEGQMEQRTEALLGSGLLLQEGQIHPGGKLVPGNRETVDLTLVCCTLTAGKCQMKRGEAAGW